MNKKPNDIQNYNLIFNTYYINFSKTYEIKMILDNSIKTTTNKQESNNTEKGVSVDGGVEVNTSLLSKIFGNLKLNSDFNYSNGRTNQVIETFEVVTTKSILLKELIKISKKIYNFNNIKEGDLIRLDNVKLSIDSEEEAKFSKMISQGAFEKLYIPGMEGMPINSIFKTFLEGYFYKIKGKYIIDNKDENNINENTKDVLIKIPINFDSINEFENRYTVNDLTIGKVSLIGIYKGTIEYDELKNIELFSFDTSNIDSDNGIFISSSTADSSLDNFNNGNDNNIDDKYYNYIDIIAIIQIINNSNNNEG